MKDRYKYTIGLDLGISSIGWAVLEVEKTNNSYRPFRMIDCGVRLFDRAIIEGQDSPASVRRENRSVRRTIRRRRHRLERTKHLLISSNLINELNTQNFNKNIYEIRTAALDKLIPDDDLARVILHIVKRRGFKSNRKSAYLESEEGGKFAQYISENAEILKRYRTVGEMMYKDKKFNLQKRNRRGNYKQMIARSMLETELLLILHTQKNLGNPKLSDALIEGIIDLFNSQRPFASGEQIVKLVGKCSLIPENLRSSKASVSIGLFRALQQIKNNIRILNTDTGEILKFSDLELENFASGLFELKSSKITFASLRKILKLEDNVNFYNLENKDAEKNTDTNIKPLKGYHEIRKKLSKIDENLWNTIKDNVIRLDKLIDILTVYKTDKDISNHLKADCGFTEGEVATIVSSLPNFSGFGHISSEAASRLIPHLKKQGIDYTKACEMEGFLSRFQGTGSSSEKLPPIDLSDVTNPHVKRAVTQARKVVNAIIQKYGKPTFIQVEFARELNKSDKERKEISKQNEENRTQNEKVVREINELGIKNPSGRDITKYKLWKEQNSKCLITQRAIHPREIFADNTTQIDHAMPYSRSFNDSFNNKILILTSVNQKKANKTPFEYFGSNNESKDWHHFTQYVNSLASMNWRKKKNLLRNNYAETAEDAISGFRDRDLNDTKYISRFLKQYLEENIQFADFDKKRRVFVVQGRMTSMLRRRHGFNKDRDLNVRHHAVDAVLVASTTPWMIQQVGEWSKNEEIGKKAPYFPTPWNGFRIDIETRIMLGEEDINKLKQKDWFREKYKDIHNNIKPIFVSRASNKKIRGVAHDATMYSLKGEDKNGLKILQTRKTLEMYKMDKEKLRKVSEDLYKFDPSYIKSLEQKLSENDNKPEKAFSRLNSGENILTKGIKGNRIYSTLERSITNDLVILTRGNSKAYAKNSKILRTDVYRKDEKFYLVPIYLPEIMSGKLPNKAISPGRKKSSWTEVDSSYDFQFSMYQNDYLRIRKSQDGELFSGYYAKVTTSTGGIWILPQDGSQAKDSIQLGSKTLFSIEKYQVDPLGRINKVHEKAPLNIIFKNYGVPKRTHKSKR